MNSFYPKVYVVTDGVYSDRHIVGVFDSKYKAEKYVEHNRNSKYYDQHDIEEYDLE